MITYLFKLWKENWYFNNYWSWWETILDKFIRPSSEPAPLTCQECQPVIMNFNSRSQLISLLIFYLESKVSGLSQEWSNITDILSRDGPSFSNLICTTDDLREEAKLLELEDQDIAPVSALPLGQEEAVVSPAARPSWRSYSRCSRTSPAPAPLVLEINRRPPSSPSNAP